MGRPLGRLGSLALFGAAAACQLSGVIEVGPNWPGASSGSATSGSSSASASGTVSTSSSSSSAGSASSSTSSSGAASSSSSSSSGSASSSSSGSSSSSTSTGGSSSGAVDLCDEQPPDGGCWSDEPDGGPCDTIADCAPGLTCLYDSPSCWYAGYCGPPAPLATLGCVSNGHTGKLDAFAAVAPHGRVSQMELNTAGLKPLP